MVKRALGIVVVVLFASCAHQAELKRAVVNEARNDYGDVKATATAPFHWDAHNWLRLGEGVGAIAAVGALDGPISRAVQRNRSGATNSYAKFITPWGASRAFDISVLMWAGGFFFHDDRIRDAGHDSLEAQVFSGLITGVLKRAGRARPTVTTDPYLFHPSHWKGGSYQSFPSGHATNAFAFATGIAGHYDGWLVPTIVYTVATSVAVARVNDHVHWPSDVVAGALIGRATAKGLVWRHAHVSVLPVKNGLMFDVR